MRRTRRLRKGGTKFQAPKSAKRNSSARIKGVSSKPVSRAKTLRKKQQFRAFVSSVVKRNLEKETNPIHFLQYIRSLLSLLDRKYDSALEHGNGVSTELMDQLASFLAISFFTTFKDQEKKIAKNIDDLADLFSKVGIANTGPNTGSRVNRIVKGNETLLNEGLAFGEPMTYLASVRNYLKEFDRLYEEVQNKGDQENLFVLDQFALDLQHSLLRGLKDVEVTLTHENRVEPDHADALADLFRGLQMNAK
jgi:hypothetical protein